MAKEQKSDAKQLASDLREAQSDLIPVQQKATEPIYKSLIKKLLSTSAIENTRVLLLYLDNLEKPLQKQLSHDFELKALVFAHIINVIRQNFNDQSLNMSDKEVDKVLRELANFFHIFRK